MRADLVQALQEAARAIRCRFVFVGQTILLQRRIGPPEGRDGYWLTIGYAFNDDPPCEDTSGYLPCRCFVAVLAGELTLDEAVEVIVAHVPGGELAMSGQLVGAVISGSRAERPVVWVLVVIAEMTSQKTGVCWPSMETLARRCRLTDRAVQAAIRKLQKLGELEVKRNAGQRGANVYRIKQEALKKQKPPKRASPPTPEAHFTPEEPEGCSPLHPTPEAGFTPPPKPTSPEPEENRNRTGKRESTRARTTTTIKSKKKTATPMPADFAISQDVAAWAAQHGYDRLDEHLEDFKMKAQAKGYTNVDWDMAFKIAIRKNWAGLGQLNATQVLAPHIAARPTLMQQFAPLVAAGRPDGAVALSFDLPFAERVDNREEKP